MEEIIKKVEKGINDYLEKALQKEKIDKQSYDLAKTNVLVNLKKWLYNSNLDIISPQTKLGIIEKIEEGKWEDIVNAFRKNMSFGTGGIRGLMAFDKESIVKLKTEGINTKILKGPNTLNDIVLLFTSVGVAKFGREKGFNKIVIGYDSRVRGGDFARNIAELFLFYGYTVYLFDEPCPYPEVTFAIPYEKIRAQLGILISASHNDYRYNGYKLSCGNGSQFDLTERMEMYNKYIATASLDEIKLLPIKNVPKGRVIFLGGEEKIKNINYFGHGDSLIDIHGAHREHVKKFLLQNWPDKKLNIGYCAFHGSGRVAVPRLLKETGFKNVKIITRRGLNELDGLFPCFNSEPGREQQPDPGDPRAAKIEVDCFKEEYLGEWEKTDILIGTDPDADRCGVVVKVPENQKFLEAGNDWKLLSADEMWSLLIWYRLKFDKKIEPQKTFLATTITTTDCLVKLALKYNLGIVRTWVGFANLSAAIRDVWEGKINITLSEGREDSTEVLTHPHLHEMINMNGERSYNIGATEQSNGFSILGSPSKDKFSLGERGHVRDKDGTFAAVLIAEVAEWAKRNKTTIPELVDKYIHLDPDIGLFINYYEPDPLDGEYAGIQGDRFKKSIINKALRLYQSAQEGKLEINGVKVKSAFIYRTGKYDNLYPPTDDFQFPDEGIRFYFDEEKMNHFIIRPSGTTNSMRFHVQLHTDVDKKNLIKNKKELQKKAKKIIDCVRELVGAPRSNEV